MSKDYSTFFDVAQVIDTTRTSTVYRLYFAEDGSILNITINKIAQGQHIEITQEQYDACYQKLQDYIVIENELVFTPPKQRTWNLTQQELERNPYVKS